MANQETIVALATATGNGAIAIIRVSGTDAIAIVNRVFKGKDLLQQPSHTLHFGTIRDGDEVLDEVLVSLFVGPNSFTGEDSVELSTHNSRYIIDRVIQLLIKSGARAALPGEFTQRAFLNGKMDLSQAEAVADLIASENRASHEIAINQMRGGIGSELAKMREQLINFTSLLELELDFGEEDVEFADRTKFLQLIAEIKSHMNTLIASFEYGNAIKQGVPVAIVGKPNAGKSTLLNTLLNEERAIVSDIAGTTRDTIEETMTIDGITFRFIDTAGLRETVDTIEAIGVARAKEKVAAAKILLYLYDGQSNTADEVIGQIKGFYREGLIVILVRNKIDLEGGYFENEMDGRIKKELFDHLYTDHIVAITAKDPASVATLKTLLVAKIRSLVTDNQQVITNIRHVEALRLAYQSVEDVERGFELGVSGELLASHLREALRHMGTITGQIDVDRDILGTIFGKFCIGK